MVGRIFQAHGEICASHPWEVIVATLTLTLCLLTVDPKPSNSLPVDTVQTCSSWGHTYAGTEVKLSFKHFLLNMFLLL